MASKKEEVGFEILYKRLEETVAKLEEGNLTLEESIALYEEGMTLARRTQEILADAELRVTRLQESFANGSALRDNTVDYSPDADDLAQTPE